MRGMSFDEYAKAAAGVAGQYPVEEHPALFVGAWLAGVAQVLTTFVDGKTTGELVDDLARVLAERFPQTTSSEEVVTVIRGLLIAVLCLEANVRALGNSEGMAATWAGTLEGAAEVGSAWFQAHAVPVDPIKLASLKERAEAVFARLGIDVDLAELT